MNRAPFLWFVIVVSLVAATLAEATLFTPSWHLPGKVLVGQGYSVRLGGQYYGSGSGFLVSLVETNGGAGDASAGNTGDYVEVTVNYVHSTAGAYMYKGSFDSYNGDHEEYYDRVDVDVNDPPTGSISAPATVPPNSQFTVGISAHDDNWNLRDMGIRQQGTGQIGYWPEAGLEDASESVSVTAPSTPGTIMNFRAEINDTIDPTGYTSPWKPVKVVAPATFSWSGGVKSFVYNGQVQTVSESDVVANPNPATFSISGQTSATNAGTYNITATASGDYSGSSPLAWTITARPITFDWHVAPDGKSVSVTTNPAGVAVTQTGTWSATVPGTYTAHVSADGPNYTGSDSHQWTITEAPPTNVTFVWQEVQDQNGKSVSATTVPAGVHYVPTGTWSASAPGDYSATATVDQSGFTGVDSHSWSIDAPSSPDVTASISVATNPVVSPAIAPASATVTWSSSDATSVSVAGYGLSSSAASGSQAVSGLPGGTYTYTITAQGTGGPVTQTATLQVADVTIGLSPILASAEPASTTISWTSVNTTSVTISGPGLAQNPTTIMTPATPTANTLPATNLMASTTPYVYTIVGHLADGRTITKTANFTVGNVGPINNVPTISWTQIPDYVAPSESFNVQAQGYDSDGNLTGVQILRNGSAFASAGAGDGYISTTPPTSYAQPATGVVTFIATATDAAGKSTTSTHNVIVQAPGGSGQGEGALPGSITLVGTLDGQVSVDNHGSANYAIPLKLPLGRAGMEPKLALNYNSAAGNGPLGLGWSLATGFPQSIVRGRTIQARDGSVRGVNFDASDKFYLDGKRLLLTGGTGAYGQPGSEYRTEVDSFVKITTTGTGTNIETFTVVDKNGTKMVFGKYNSATDGYQNAPYDANFNPETLAYAYALKHVEDALGNSVDLTYTTANDGEFELAEMSYTGNSTANVAAQARVRLVYDLNVVPGNPAGRTARLDQPTHYVAGRGFPLRKRLDRVVAEIDPGPALSTVYSLDYDYSPNGGPTRLKSVQGYFRDPVSGDLKAAPATTIAWSGAPSSYTKVTNRLVPTNPAPETHAFADMNGDGRDDFVDWSNGANVSVALSVGNGFGIAQNWSSGIALSSGALTVAKLCDINGDGKKDLIYGNPLEAASSNKKLYALVSTDSGFVSIGEIFTFTDEFHDPGQPANSYFFQQAEVGAVTNRIATGDFTGDGRDDILIHRYDGKLTLLTSTGTAFTATTNINVGAHSLDGRDEQELFGFNFLGFHMTQNFSVSMIPCELNGDGIMDYAWIESRQRWDSWAAIGSAEAADGGKAVYAVTSQPGGGFSPCVEVGYYGWYASSMSAVPYRSTSYVIMPADVNGDGLMDFTFISPGEVEPDGSYLLHHQFNISVGASGMPRFRGGFGAIPTTVTVGGQPVHPWFDKISTGLWTGDRYSQIGTLLSPEAQRPMFLTLGSSSAADNMTMTDVNGDGMADYVWYVDAPAAQAGWWVMYSRGETFADPVACPMGWTPTEKYQAGIYSLTLQSRSSLDLNGDGIPDYAYDSHLSEQAPGVAGFYISSGQRGDHVTGVTNGLNSGTTVQYLPLTSDSIYSDLATPPAYPLRELRSSSYVVSDVYKDSGGAATAHFQYQYSGNLLDLSGRGSLGFHSFVTLDTQTQILKYQFLAQSFPMTGLTQREQTYRYWPDGANADFRLISSHDNTVVFDKVMPNGATLYPFISQATEKRWEDSSNTEPFSLPLDSPSSQPEALFPLAKPTGAHISISSQSLFDTQTVAQTTLPGVSGYNPTDLNGANHAPVGSTTASIFSTLPGKITYGNLAKLVTDYGDGFTETVDTAYLPPVGNLTGLVQNVTTTVTSPGYGTEVAPIKRYTYWGSTPLVETETFDASDNRLDLTTTYTREPLLGRVTNVSVSGTDLLAYGGGGTSFTTRRVGEFDAKFLDLPKIEFNAYDHQKTTAYDSVWGRPTSVTGANNDVTTTNYDALGRVVEVHDVLKDLYTNSSYAYDTSQSVTPPAGVERGVEITSAYRVTVSATAKPSVTTYYDRLGRPIRTIKEGFNGNTTTDTAYDDLGRVIAVSNPYPGTTATAWTTTHYDALGRVSTVTAPNGTETTTTYNGRATIMSVDAPDLGGINPAPQVNSTVVDAKGRTVKVWNADNVPSFSDTLGTTTTAPSLAFALDGFGRMRDTTLRGQSDHITATYDAFGRQTSLNDPDKGPWSYVNSVLGYVLQQSDARNTVTTTSYDALGRPLTRSTHETSGATETAGWFYYDATADAQTHRLTFTEKGWIGALQREEVATTDAPGYAAANSRTTTAHYYDTKGRPSMDLTTIDSKWFYTTTDYDAYSRVQHVHHYWRPAGHEAPDDTPYIWNDFGYTYNYSAKSYLLSLTDSNSPARTWWEADSTGGYDYLDRPVLVRKGSGHWTQRTYRPEDGVLTAIQTGPSAGASSIQNLSFNYDGLGNLTSRTGGGGTETFGYDLLNRLTTRNGTTIASYLDNGNIDTKTDVGGATSPSYGYAQSGKPHAVTSAWGYSLHYDANGNLDARTKGAESWNLAYAGFDKPRWMTKIDGSGTHGSEFLYNANRSRTLQLEFDAMSGGAPSHYVRKRVYALGSTLEINYHNAAATGAPTWTMDKVRIYVPGPEGVIGAREFDPGPNGTGTEKALVYHYDHLGSIESITDFGSTAVGYAVDTATPAKPGRFSEDAWGQRRDPLTWSGPPTTTDDGGHDSLTPRGFTGHEMLDDLGLVHMNGRIYDPLLGRFLSADILVENPANLQAYNRYSYVRNNPLTLTDPTGWYSVMGLEFTDGGGVSGFFSDLAGYGGDVATGASYGSSNYADGFVRGAANTAVDLGRAALHPSDTLQAAVDGIGTTAGRAIYDTKALAGEIKNDVVATLNDPNKLGQSFGGGTVNTAAGAGAARALGAAGELASKAAQTEATAGEAGVTKAAPAPGNPATTPVGDLRAAGLKDAHHVIQDAAVRDVPGYNTQAAPGVQLPGPSTAKGTPHNAATLVQRQAGGGTYGAERRIGYKALRAAGFSPQAARKAIESADAFFKKLGVTRDTPTRTPGNRKKPNE